MVMIFTSTAASDEVCKPAVLYTIEFIRYQDQLFGTVLERDTVVSDWYIYGQENGAIWYRVDGIPRVRHMRHGWSANVIGKAEVY